MAFALKVVKVHLVKANEALNNIADLLKRKPPPPAQMEMGFRPGLGFDQIWAKRGKNGNVIEYFIVEAKGPGAKLSKKAKKGRQMSVKWIRKTIESMRKAKFKKTSTKGMKTNDEWIKANMENLKKHKDKNQLGQALFDAIENEIKVNKLVIEAVEKNGAVIGGKLQPLPIEKI